MTFLNFNKSPVAYGAIMYNGSAGPGIASCYPFFTSQTILSSFINDVDDYWTVMPGYKLIVYTDGLDSAILLSVDNTNGVAPTTYKISSPNLASSLRLFFKDTLIVQPS
jgi:hypothetical protein